MIFLVLDANILISLFDEKDSMHRVAKELMLYLLPDSDLKAGIKIIIPKLCISEIVITLRAKGFNPRDIEENVRQFIDQPYVVVLDVSEMQIHKFAGPVPKRELGKKLVRTSDYLIGMLARVLDGTVLTFDQDFDKICSFCKSIILKTEQDVEDLRIEET